MKSIFIIRHGETNSVVTKKLCGRTDDVITKNGLSQIEKLLNILKTINPDKIFSSPLIRAKQSAEILTSHFKKDIIILENLKEIDFGDYEGLTLDEVKKNNLNDYENWINHPGKYTPNNGEKLSDLVKRIKNIFNEIINDKEDNKIYFIVTHGGPIRASLINALDIPLDSYWNIKIPHGSVTKYEYEDGALKLCYMGQVGY